MRPQSRSSARLFVGVPLTDAVRQELDAHLRQALGGRSLPGRPVPPANWHLTLKFLGSTDAGQQARLVELLRQAPLGAAFPLEFGGLGAFPKIWRASVLWVGVSQGQPELGALARVLEDAAAEAGFAREQRPFAAHLTLSRIDPPQDATDVVSTVPAFAGRMEVREVVLFRSHLGGGPARYEPLERFPLS
ncbi:MAG TPA: RNA 2',3'-cyclic phosphodiesterase [Longimicrobiaceae bacterium]|nr:RNA 2',3'-cyclic phosphodiesterase [Longimicrobiaceae bacterium]